VTAAWSATRTPSNSWLICDATRSGLKLVERLLLAVGGPEPFASELCTHLARSGGKRLRPALVLLAARLGNECQRDAVPIATGVELVHLASLYFDDVMDESNSRRGSESANARWGNLNAVLAADYLLARANELIASAGDELSSALAETAERLWRGQVRETSAAYNLDLEQGAWLENVQLKTSSLCEFACHAGAVVGGVRGAQAEALRTFGFKLGTLFQLTDDVLDLIADESQLGKPPGTDLLEGIYTMPVIVTLAGRAEGRERLRQILGRGKPGRSELKEAIALLKCNQSIAITMQMAAAVAHEAHLAVQRLPDGDTMCSLQNLVDFVLNRVVWTHEATSER